MKLGIIGTGNIATFLLDELSKNDPTQAITIVSIFGRNNEKGSELSEKYDVAFYEDFDQFLESEIEVVVEAATVEVVKDIGERVVESRKDFVISSVGAMADLNFYNKMEELATKNNVHIYIPSGAVGAIDAIKSANALGELQKVALTTRKPPASFGMEDKLAGEKIIYEGSAKEAISKFPKNINVSIVLSLAGIGAEQTTVTIVADPNIIKNTHTIKATGAFGSLQFTVENESMPANPKTSYLAALSILSVLKNKYKRVQIGS